MGYALLFIGCVGFLFGGLTGAAGAIVAAFVVAFLFG